MLSVHFWCLQLHSQTAKVPSEHCLQACTSCQLLAPWPSHAARMFALHAKLERSAYLGQGSKAVCGAGSIGHNVVLVWVVLLLVDAHHKHRCCRQHTSVTLCQQTLMLAAVLHASGVSSGNKMGVMHIPSADGAEMTTFLAPPFK